MAKRRRKYENEFSYEITVSGWEARVSFNDYAYLNMFDRGPFEYSAYISLCGTLTSCASKKLEKNMLAEVVLHPTAGYERVDEEFSESPVGDMIVIREGELKKLIARIRIPFQPYELIKSYMMYEPRGVINLIGANIQRRKADIFCISFNSKKP